jgi:hypothetical protein
MRYEKVVQYFGGPVKVACDGNCRKAWGMNSRPEEQLSDDIDDNVYLSDSELGEAPEDPGTYEGGQGKPSSPDYFPNKWCVRECERCRKSEYGKHDQPLELRDFSRRVYNQPWKHPEAGKDGPP